jgi:choice-of-anchor A domain-containing protein
VFWFVSFGSDSSVLSGWGGSGSGIFPYLGTFLQVGGNIAGGKVEGTTQSMVGGTIEYGGTCVTETPLASFTDSRCGTWHTNGAGIFTKVTMDKQPWMDLFEDLQQKSLYWSSLVPNGIVSLTDLDASESTITLEKGNNDDCIQVFKLSQIALAKPAKMILHPSLVGKTILINVELAPDGTVTIDKLTNVIDTVGTSGLSFESTTKASMLWNFAGATTVTLGTSQGGGIVFPGTVLVPNGNLNMLLPGQDGRTIVYGNVYHNAPGSQFHNYDFDPPCALCTGP